MRSFCLSQSNWIVKLSQGPHKRHWALSTCLSGPVVELHYIPCLFMKVNGRHFFQSLLEERIILFWSNMFQLNRWYKSGTRTPRSFVATSSSQETNLTSDYLWQLFSLSQAHHSFPSLGWFPQLLIFILFFYLYIFPFQILYRKMTY